MVSYPELLILGAFAGLTIFLGLPIAVIQGLSSNKRGFLNAVAIGILIFLTVEVFSHAWETASDAAVGAFVGRSSLGTALLDLLAMFGGMAIGLLGLTWYAAGYMNGDVARSPIVNSDSEGNGGTANSSGQRLQLVEQIDVYRLAMMIAIGIGAHNFSEGLAIGQSYASGAIGLALILIIGFAVHNTTEGFGIASPLTGLSRRPGLRFLVAVGLVGGGPTFIGTVLGSLWSSTLAYIFFLAVAGGALVYVSMLMFNSGRRQTTNTILMIGFFVGLFAGFITDLMVTLGGA